MTTDNQPQFNTSINVDPTIPPSDGILVESSVAEGGFRVMPVEFVTEDGISSAQPSAPFPVKSSLSSSPAITGVELIELSGGTGKLLYYPVEVPLAPGDVLYLREREQGENGIIVQVITKETATYAQAGSKVLWRLLTKVRAQELQRAHHEPAEVIDLFLSATVKVRASVEHGKWLTAAGNIVTRNVDIFLIDPQVLTQNILVDRPKVNIALGTFKGQPVVFSGQSFDKVNLIPGMKGAGKSHITKGIIDESRKRMMSSVVFDINDEYRNMPGAIVFIPTVDLKFRLDRVAPRSFLDVIDRLAPFPERTSYPAKSGITNLFRQRKASNKPIDIKFLKEQKDIVITGTSQYIGTMRDAYLQSLETIETRNLFATEQEIRAEDAAIKSGQSTEARTLSSVFYTLDQQQQAGVIVFAIGGLQPVIQRIVVRLVLDALKELCDGQTKEAKKNPLHIPIYPTVFFEEAHMYMDEKDINEFIPIIRHLGMNLFFITNTPGELPDSVFRLLDNLIMTRMLNDADIKCVAKCGLADKETIEGFAPEIPEHHALILSAKDGITKTFPLIFEVRDFGFPASGVTRSMWHALDTSVSTTSSDASTPSFELEE